MVSDGHGADLQRPLLTILPGLMILLTVLSLNVFGDGLRDALDPRAKIRLEAHSGETATRHRARGLPLMGRFIVRRLVGMVLVLFAISVLVFLIFNVIPNGDPAASGSPARTATPGAGRPDAARTSGFNDSAARHST